MTHEECMSKKKKIIIVKKKYAGTETIENSKAVLSAFTNNLECTFQDSQVCEPVGVSVRVCYILNPRLVNVPNGACFYVCTPMSTSAIWNNTIGIFL